MPFPQCSGKVDDHLSGHTRPASQIKTSTVMVLPAIYPLFLQEITLQKQTLHAKTVSSTHSNNKVEQSFLKIFTTFFCFPSFPKPLVLVTYRSVCVWKKGLTAMETLLKIHVCVDKALSQTQKGTLQKQHKWHLGATTLHVSHKSHKMQLRKLTKAHYLHSCWVVKK